MWHNWNRERAMAEIVLGMLEYLGRILSACILGGFVAYWLVPIAYRQRGYFAAGGEWLIILVTMFAASELSAWLWARRK